MKVRSGDKVISDFKGGFATVTISYTQREGDNPHAVVVWYLNDLNDMKSVRGSYLADFKNRGDTVTFTDIPDHVCYKNAVDFISAKRITQGTGNNQYNPDATMNPRDLYKTDMAQEMLEKQNLKV